MIIIGLGTNIGNRLQHLRQALCALKKVSGLEVKQVSPVYLSEAQLPENAPADWNQWFLNCAISCETSLTPKELLAQLKKIEIDLGRDAERKTWSPRVIDIDILAWNDEVIATPDLNIPHPRLLSRPFALWPLSDLVPAWRHPGQQLAAEQLVESWESRFTGKAPFHTKQIQQRIDTPQLVGIINLTPDSFSDGGKLTTAEQALHHAIHLVEAGAEILDIGAEATSPTSTRITPAIEWQRLEPVLTSIIEAKKFFLCPPIISVDTRHAEVAVNAIKLGVDWINDVTGFNDPAMRAAVRDANVDCVVMHHLTIPPTQNDVLPRGEDPTEFLYSWAEKQIAMLEADGIKRERIIIDPGIGFGKSPGQNVALLNNMSKLSKLGVRILVGHSRKRFIRIFTSHEPHDRDIETLTMTIHLAKQPIDYIRLHNVEISARALRVQAALS